MFKDVIVGQVGMRLKVKKGLIMILSFLLHSTIIFAVLFGPLIETDTTFSEIKVVDVFVAQTPPQPPQAQRGKAKATKKTETRREVKKETEEVKKKVTQKIGVLVTPVKIPVVIFEEEDDFLSSIDEGIEDGIEGGVEGLDNDSIVSGIIGENVMVGGHVKRIIVREARRIKYVKPIYPATAAKARIRAKVVIEARTDIFGNVVYCKIIAGHSLLNGAAIEAVKKWKYEPYLVGGVPKPVVFTVTINFTLSK